MKEFYTRYYDALRHSAAHAEFCERVFGRNLAQHGFADMAQLDLVLNVTRLGPQHSALDLGCGSGLITEYLSDCSGARFTGLDYIPDAIAQARERTADKASRLAFVVGDMNNLDLAPRSLDAIISIDTLYFPDDLPAVVGRLEAALTPAGQMAVLYSHGWEPWKPREEFDTSTLAPDRTPLGVALLAHGLTFSTIDLTAEDYQLAKCRKEVLLELKPRFEADDIMFIYENRWGDSNGVMQAIEAGLQKRYLYHVRP